MTAKRKDWGRRIAAALLAGLFTVASTSNFARGRKGGGGMADLLDDDVIAPSAGLPANLTPGIEPVGRIGDTNLVGLTGVPNAAGGNVVINSSGQQVVVVPALTLSGGTTQAAVLRRLGPDALAPLVSLKQVPIPPVSGLSNFVRDRAAAIVLGKALFWDAQVGSDGNACASCHFHAGADNRMKNQISPGFLGGDTHFKLMPTGIGGPNYTLKASDFPTYRLADPLDRNSPVLFDTNDVVSSQGTFGAPFLDITVNGAKAGEKCGPAPRDEFGSHGIATRRVEPRNTPTVINAVFNYRNFWDGRANNVFNGVSPFGPRDKEARVLEALPDGTTQAVMVALPNASLASQAVGPALSQFEMSCSDKAFKDLGRKMLRLQPLALQEVHAKDSVLAKYRTRTGRGLMVSYPDLIKKAFDPRWWSSTRLTGGYTQMEHNFSLFWGLAIMLYESTLVSDQAPIDHFVGSLGVRADPKALDAQQQRGLALFRGKALCVSCHRGAEFTAAATSLQPVDDGEGTLVESMIMGDGTVTVYDNGFYNIGVRPSSEDRGVGGADPWGGALSYTRMWFDELRGKQVSDPLRPDPCRFGVFFSAKDCWFTPDPNDTRVAVDGTFKTPSLRNVSLTAPYFHNGSRLTLDQVLEFYNRGGDRRGSDEDNSTGLVAPDATNGGRSNAHPDIHPLNLTRQEMLDLAAFLRHALTDPRVACERAPFDHPSLRIPNGHAGNETRVLDRDRDGRADDEWIALPAVGAAGVPPALCMRNDDGSEVTVP